MDTNEYKTLDFYTDSEELTVHDKVKSDVTEMLKRGWVVVFTLKFKEYITIFFKRRLELQNI